MFYPFNQINDRVYHFVTDESILYHVSFSLEEVDMDLDPKVKATLFNIILAPIGSKKATSKDYKIGKTIFNIICDFENKNVNSCFAYTSDFSDGRQYSRNLLFNRWIDSYGKDNYNAINLDIYHASIDETYYSTLLFSIKYIYEPEITKAFEKKINDYQALKA